MKKAPSEDSRGNDARDGKLPGGFAGSAASRPGATRGVWQKVREKLRGMVVSPSIGRLVHRAVPCVTLSFGTVGRCWESGRMASPC